LRARVGAVGVEGDRATDLQTRVLRRILATLYRTGPGIDVVGRVAAAGIEVPGADYVTPAGRKLLARAVDAERGAADVDGPEHGEMIDLSDDFLPHDA